MPDRKSSAIRPWRIDNGVFGLGLETTVSQAEFIVKSGFAAIYDRVFQTLSNVLNGSHDEAGVREQLDVIMDDTDGEETFRLLDNNGDGELTMVEVCEADSVVPRSIVEAIHSHLKLGAGGEDVAGLPGATPRDIDPNARPAEFFPNE